jgi:hypothetical protein
VGLTFKKGEEITFNFLGTLYKGIVIDPVIQDNTIKVNYNGTVHRVGLTEKDSKYCFLHDGKSR